MKIRSFILLLLTLSAPAVGKSVHPTSPPMGWNSFDSYGVYLHHDAALEQIRAMARYQAVGYEYFVIDAGWWGEYTLRPCTKFAAERHASRVRIDQNGIVHPSECYFDQGLKVLADSAHARGLKFGVHLMRGIPKEAYRANTPVKGTRYTARDIADTVNVCTWNRQNYGVNMEHPAGQAYYNSVVDQLALWGVDFIKVDDVVPYPREVQGYIRAVERCKRPILLSLSPGDKIRDEDLHALRGANMLRITADIWDAPAYIDAGFAAWRRWAGKNSAGFWLDLDMIPFGELQKMSPPNSGEKDQATILLSGRGSHRWSEFNPAQQRTFITQRAMAASPLMIGGDLATMDPYAFYLLTHPPMVRCNQNGVMGRLVYQHEGIETWHVPGGWVGVFNRNPKPKSITLTTQTIGFDPSDYVWDDIWNDRAAFATQSYRIEAEDVLFLRYTKAPKEQLSTSSFVLQIDARGRIESYTDRASGATLRFRADSLGGPMFEGVTLHRTAPYTYQGFKEGIVYKIQYKTDQGAPVIEASINNNTQEPFVPNRTSLRLGIDTYMERFPEWNDVPFPTMLRAERSHFSGYLMTPTGQIFTIASPDPVASWHYNYEQSPATKDGQTIYWGAHRIPTISIDLLHRLPLPEHHPAHLYQLAHGANHTVRLLLGTARSLTDLPKWIAEATKAPFLTAKSYTLPQNKPFEGTMFGRATRVEVKTPINTIDTLHFKGNQWSYLPYAGVGEYTITASNSHGKISTARLYVRPSFSYYLDAARLEGLRSAPTYSHHAECFYPFYTYFLARRYQPNPVLDKQGEAIFQRVFPILFDSTARRMRTYPERIQDAATMIGILADRYAVTRDTNDMARAAELIDFLVSTQGSDGGYYNTAHKVHYTAVIYIAKSIIEAMEHEKELGWQVRYQRHKQSVERALDDLAARGDDIQTEGQMTFEDGMISCATAQLALGAIKTSDKARQAQYLQAAQLLDDKHRCLTQMVVPDSRQNGATLRFWEYQYTVNLMHNAMNSPCGWSAWKVYGSWYLYLLTGRYEYLQQVQNAIGSCLQLLDVQTGKLRFSYMSDPYIEAAQYTQKEPHSRTPVLRRTVYGQQYIDQISSWHNDSIPAWREKWGIDNFVHEIFKCMVEVMYDKAYLIELENGTLQGINCTAKRIDGFGWQVDYTEPTTQYLHLNLRTNHQIKHNHQTIEAPSGLSWLDNKKPTALNPL